MIIPTLSTYLYEINRNRQHLQDVLDKRKAFRYVIAIFTCIAVITFAVIIRPVPFGGKPSQNQITTQRDR